MHKISKVVIYGQRQGDQLVGQQIKEKVGRNEFPVCGGETLSSRLKKGHKI